jgi:hypothetical protein
MLAVDTATGEVVWAAKGEGLLSPAISDDGTILTGDIFAAPTVVALKPQDGSRKWARSYDDYAATVLPTLAAQAPEFPSGKPVARLVSVISASADTVWVGMNLGYDFHQPGTGLRLPVPHKTVVCALRPRDGELLDCVEVRDTVEGMINVGTAGRLSVSHTTIFGSFFYYGLNSKLPKRFQSPMLPVCGLTAMQPLSFCQQLQLEVDRVTQLSAQLAQAVSAGNLPEAAEFARKAAIQTGAMDDTLELAASEKKITRNSFIILRNKLHMFSQNIRRLRSSVDSDTIDIDQLDSLDATTVNTIAGFCA